MNIEKKISEKNYLFKVSGRLDTTTAPALEKEFKESFGNVEKIILDFNDLEYISSAGLRVVLGAHKAMQGNLIVKNVNELVMEVFEVTGFADILNIE